MAAISPFCTPANEIAGRKVETQALNESRPGYDGNTLPPQPIPETGEATVVVPASDLNLIKPEVYNGDTMPSTPVVIAADGDKEWIIADGESTTGPGAVASSPAGGVPAEPVIVPVPEEEE